MTFRGLARLDFEWGFLKAWVDEFVKDYTVNLQRTVNDRVAYKFKRLKNAEDRKKNSANYTEESNQFEEQKLAAEEEGLIEGLEKNHKKLYEKAQRAMEALMKEEDKLSAAIQQQKLKMIYDERSKGELEEPLLDEGFDEFEPLEFEMRKSETFESRYRKLNSFHRTDWAQRLIAIKEWPEDSPKDVEFKYFQMSGIHEEFAQMAATFGATIIRERYLKVEEMTIKPVSSRAADFSGFVRHKYEVCNIRFSFATDEDGIHNGSDEAVSSQYICGICA